MSMIKGDDLRGKELFNFLIESFSNIISFCNDKAPIYICNNWHCSHIYYSVFKKLNLNLDAWVVWNKDWLSVGHGDYRSNHEFIFYSKRKSSFYAPKGTEHDVWTIRKLSPDKKIHTTQKPVELVERAIHNSSLINQIILDNFGGSGSTLIACEKLKRKCYMMEIDPHYIDVIVKRYKNYTGKKAKLIENFKNRMLVYQVK